MNGLRRVAGMIRPDARRPAADGPGDGLGDRPVDGPGDGLVDRRGPTSVSSTSPAVARLRRTRRLMTLLFGSTTAACLVVLAAVAVHIDSESRRSGLDHEVDSRAVGLSQAVWFDDGALHLDPLREDELARSAEVLAVLQTSPADSPSVWNVVPSRPALPERDWLDHIWRSVQEEQETVIVSAPSEEGGRLRWAAAPVWDGDRIGAAVLVGTELARSEQEHDELVRWLALGCTALVCCAAAVGHLLSGRAMRPALLALEQQEQFLAEAAHELRTPLATLRLVVEREGSSDEALRLVDRLSRLVTGLLARARAQAGAQRAELVPLRLDQLVETTVEELPDHESVRVRSEPVVVLGDPDLLAQAVRNLVENAQRHGGPAGSPVEVTVSPGLVTVRDHGAGVPLADRERVFARGVTGVTGGSEAAPEPEAVVRTEVVLGTGAVSETGASGTEAPLSTGTALDTGTALGTGAGLAIVRWVAELHHGTAHLADAPGGGLIAELRLPRHPERTEWTAPSSSSHEGSDIVGA
ncbi:sensor histidine kinase [Streptomyces aurantiacus]|uniref:sensor histidine kinase n=1 Tax=Streptomyces aurantiacus TaxID=47760 RepID=UPI000B1F6737|nr:HAMP domain-containing sensor histidine kinase [Streptomyces aurantiacus]